MELGSNDHTLNHAINKSARLLDGCQCGSGPDGYHQTFHTFASGLVIPKRCFVKILQACQNSNREVHVLSLWLDFFASFVPTREKCPRSCEGCPPLLSSP